MSDNNGHIDFGQKESENVVGRDKELAELQNLFAEKNLVIITGKSGVGKTALAAHVGERVKSVNSECMLIQHYVGILPNSNQQVNLLQNLYNQLCAVLTIQSQSLSSVDLVHELPKLIELCKKRGKHLLIVIDGVENLENPLEFCELNWISQSHGTSVKCIVTCQESRSDLCELLKRNSRVNAATYTLKGLEISVRKEMVRKILKKNGKKLEESAFNNQMHLLISKRDACLPQYISLACNEVKIHGDFEELTKMIQHLPASKEQLLKQMVEKLEEDYGSNQVGLSFQVLAMTKDGLTSDELQHILCHADNLEITSNGKLEVKKLSKIQNEDDFIINFCGDTIHKIPIAHFQPFQTRLQAILRYQDASAVNDEMVLKDVSLRKIVYQKYLKAKQLQRKIYFKDGKQNWSVAHVFHMLLTCYHLKKVSIGNTGEMDSNIAWKSSSFTPVQIIGFHSEFSSKSRQHFQKLLQHFQETKAKRALLKLLTSLKFILSMIKLDLISMLLDQLNFLSQMEEFDPILIQPYIVFISKNLQNFIRDPNCFWQQALNEQSIIGQQATSTIHEGNKQLPPGCDSLALALKTPRALHYLEVELCSQSQDEIQSLAFSPNAKLLASGSSRGTIRIFDVKNSTEYATLVGHSGAVTCILFLRSDRLVSSSSDSTICLWDIRNKNRIKVLNQHRDVVVTEVKAHPNQAESFASVALDSKIYFWKSKSGEEITKISSRSPVNCLSYHPHGLKVSTGHWDSTVRIFDTALGQQKAVLRAHDHAVRFLTYTDNGHQIFSIDLAGNAIFWQAEINLPIRIFTPHNEIDVTSMAICDQSYFTGDKIGCIKVWPSWLCSPNQSMEVKEASCVAMVQKKRLLFVVVGFHSGSVTEYQICATKFSQESVQTRKCHSKRVTSIMYFEVLGNDPTATYHEDLHILSTSDDGSYQIHKSDTLECEYKFESLSGILSACVISPISSQDVPNGCNNVSLGDDILIITGLSDCSVLVHSLVGYSGFPHISEQNLRELNLRAHRAPVTGISYSRNASTIFTSGRDGCTYLWQLSDVLDSLYGSNTLLSQVEPHSFQFIHNDWINSSCWSEDFEALITCSNDNSIRYTPMTDLSGTMKECINGTHEAGVNKVVVKDKILFSASSDGSVGIWSKSKNALVQLNKFQLIPSKSFLDLDVVQTKHNHVNHSEAKDMTDIIDRCIVVTLTSASIEFWQPFNTNPLLTLGQAGQVTAMAVAPKTAGDHENIIATASSEGPIKLLRPSTGGKDGSHYEHRAPVVDLKLVAFGDQELIISGGKDGVIQGHLHSGGSLKKVFETSLYPNASRALKFLTFTAFSDAVLAVGHIGTEKDFTANSHVGLLFIYAAEDRTFQTRNLSSHMNQTITLKAKSYKTSDKDLFMLVAETTDECHLNLYQLQEVGLVSQFIEKGKTQRRIRFQRKQSILLDDWVSDFCWLDHFVTVTFSKTATCSFPVSFSNSNDQDPAVVSDYQKLVMFVDHQGNCGPNQVDGIASEIVAYDVIENQIFVATKDKHIQFWRGGAFVGELKVDANVTSLSVSMREEQNQVETARETIVCVGSQHGELTVLKWLW